MEEEIKLTVLFNARRAWTENPQGVWYSHMAISNDYIEAGTRQARLCNITEGFMEFLRGELDSPNLHFSDVEFASEEDEETGDRHTVGHNLLSVWTGNGYTKVQIPDEIVEAVNTAIETASTVIVSRHPGAIEYITSKGFVGRVSSHLTGEAVERGVTYIGVLPLLMIEKIIKAGGQFILLSLPQITLSERGQELSSDEMKEAGATLHRIISFEMEEI